MRYKVLIAAIALATAACSSGDKAVTNPGAAFSSLLVDASASTAYLALGDEASVLTVTSPSTSTSWDLAFDASPAVTVNGGASGPGDVQAYCLCANRNLSLVQIEALTPQAGADMFGGVTAASIPDTSAFQSDSMSQAIHDWYSYNPATHAVTLSPTVWGIRLVSTAGAYAKLHITAMPTPGQTNAGPLTLEWAVQATSSGTMGADRQRVVDLSSGTKQYVNLTTGDVSSSAASAWDIALQGYTITVNGGASGTGNVGVVSLVPSSFYTSYAAITSIPVGATGIPSSAFASDGAGGAFLAAPPYRYDPVSHQIYPTFDVYLVKRGSTVYKVQVTSYYNAAGVFGFVTVRYARLTS